MGIESDQVVYEYLSRVGDIAQQRQLSSATRMRLVSELRNEIDRRRAKAPVDSPAAVRRIIDRLGSPDDVVEAASGDSGGAPQAPAPAVPVQREEAVEPPPESIRGFVPQPRDGTQTPDWWRHEPDASGFGEEVPGFVGGVEIPDMLKRPKPRAQEAEEQEPEDRPQDGGTEAEAPASRRGVLSVVRGGRWGSPVLLLAAGALLAGTVVPRAWLLLALGWLVAYLSRRLTEWEKKWVVIGLPGYAAAAGVVWLWGRSDGRWGEPVAKGHMNEALTEAWPWMYRGAAVALAVFLVWRARRQP